MKTILCYGDSNTWGFDPATKERFAHDVRWTGIMQRTLGEGYRVIEEGLNGRTTVWDDPIMGFQNGKTYLLPCLETHRPLDLVIIMLGTNDLKNIYTLNAYNIAAGAGVLARMVLKSDAERNGNPPKVLLVSPARIAENIGETWLGEIFGESSVQQSKDFAKYYRAVADELGCAFLDAAQYVKASPLDAVHFDSDGHRSLGQAMAEKVKTILN